MNDLGAGAESMDQSYLWRVTKRGQRAHILNPETGRAHCQAENCTGGRAFDGRGTGIPDGRRLCGNCIDLAGRLEPNYAEPDVRVLLGEKLAEVEPELFAGLVAPAPEQTNLTSSHRAKKWKQGKQARRGHRSKWGKPKRSNVKYSRPFDDDLPW